MVEYLTTRPKILWPSNALYIVITSLVKSGPKLPLTSSTIIHLATFALTPQSYITI